VTGIEKFDEKKYLDLILDLKLGFGFKISKCPELNIYKIQSCTGYHKMPFERYI
jgi:hypothetical protein